MTTEYLPGFVELIEPRYRGARCVGVGAASDSWRRSSCARSRSPTTAPMASTARYWRRPEAFLDPAVRGGISVVRPAPGPTGDAGPGRARPTTCAPGRGASATGESARTRRAAPAATTSWSRSCPAEPVVATTLSVMPPAGSRSLPGARCRAPAPPTPRCAPPTGDWCCSITPTTMVDRPSPPGASRRSRRHTPRSASSCAPRDHPPEPVPALGDGDGATAAAGPTLTPTSTPGWRRWRASCARRTARASEPGAPPGGGRRGARSASARPTRSSATSRPTTASRRSSTTRAPSWRSSCAICASSISRDR